MKTSDLFRKGKFLSLFFFLFLPLLLPGGGIARIRILQTTDLHGQYSDGKEAVSAARLGTVIERLRREAGSSSTLYIDCGDLFQGTLESVRNGKGAHFARILDLWGCDAFIPGNHDFDFGVPAFIRALQPFRGKILACNLSLEKKALPVLPWAIFQRDGVKIGVLGIAPRFMDQWFHPLLLEGANFDNRWNVFSSALSSLMRAKPHIIILAMHEGEYHSPRKEPGRTRKKEQYLSRIFREYPQILLVLGGHTHQISSGKRIYRGQWYVQAPPHAKGVACIDIQWNKKEKRLLSLQSKIVSSAGEKPHPPTAKLLFPAAGRVSRESRKAIGYFPRALAPLKRRETSNPLSRLFCQSMLEAVKADIAFHGTLSDYFFRGGLIRERHIFLLAPYENPLVTIPLTKEECQRVLEEQFRSIRKGYFQDVRGLAYEMKEFQTGKRGKRRYIPFNPKTPLYTFSPSGRKILWQDGEKTVAFTAYALSGAGGRFPILRSIGQKKADRITLHPVTIREAFRNYIIKHHPSRKYVPPQQKGKL